MDTGRTTNRFVNENVLVWGDYTDLADADESDVVVISPRHLRKLVADQRPHAVPREYADLLEASQAVREWARENEEKVGDLPIAVQRLIEACRPGCVSSMIEMLARDEARVLHWRRAELIAVIDRGGPDAEAAVTELAEVDARLNDAPIGDTPEQVETWRVLHKFGKAIEQAELPSMPVVLARLAKQLGVDERSVQMSYGFKGYTVSVRVVKDTTCDVASGSGSTVTVALEECAWKLSDLFIEGWEVQT